MRADACITSVRVYRLRGDLLAKFQGLRPRVMQKTEHTVPTPGGPPQKPAVVPCPAALRERARAGLGM